MNTPGWDPKWGPPPPPSPTVSATGEARGRGVAAPSSLTILVALQLGSSLWSVVMVHDRMPACAGIGLVLELAVLYFLWAGRRWAWMLAQVFAAFSLLAFAVVLLPSELLARVGALSSLKLILDGVLGIASLWVLNTSAVRDYVIASRRRESSRGSGS